MKSLGVYVTLVAGFAFIFFNIVLNRMEILSTYQCILFGIAILLLIPLRFSIHNRSRKNLSKLFDELNISKLKIHILFKVNECPNNGLIKDVCLYRGDEDLFKYNIVVRAKNIDGFKSIKGFWEKEAPNVFRNNFYEIYVEKPQFIYPNQKGSFWRDWDCQVVSTIKELSNSYIDLETKMVLYKK